MHIKLLLIALFGVVSVSGNVTIPVQTSRTVYNRTIANKISKKVRLMCFVLTSPENHYTRAIHIKNTWGRRCNLLLFMSSSEDPKLPTIALTGKEGVEYTWSTVRDSFKYIHKHYIEDIDWVLKVDDDTYVIVENLKYMLFGYNPNKPYYFGHQLKTQVNVTSEVKGNSTVIHTIYMYGGAGYVISKESLRRFVEIAFHNPTLCNYGSTSTKLEDVEMGLCMRAINVTAVDSRDVYGKERFIGVPLRELVLPQLDQAYEHYWSSRVYNVSMGIIGISNNPISFHNTKPAEMYLFEFLLYLQRPFGLNTVSQMVYKINQPANTTTKKAAH